MTIHHDKLAYGKLASQMEEMSEEQLLQMLKLVNEGEEELNEKQNLPQNDQSEKQK